MEDGGGYGNDDVLGLHGSLTDRGEDRRQKNEKSVKGANASRLS